MVNADRQALDRAYEAAWQQFVAGGRVEPAHRTAEDEDRLHLVFLCPVGESPEVIAAVAPLQSRLGSDYGDLVPGERLHVSIQGFDVDHSDWAERREEVLGAAQAVFAAAPPFTLHLGWANAFPMAAFLRAEDGGMIRRLRAALRAVLPAWAGLDRDPLVRAGVDQWLPHLSLAYYKTVHDNRALVEAIAPFRQDVIVAASVREIHLISTPRNAEGAERWVWPVHGVFGLGQGLTKL